MEEYEELNCSGFDRKDKLMDAKEWFGKKALELGQEKCYKLDLSNNGIQSLPDLNQFTAFNSLLELKLWGNNIETINSVCIPATVQVLDLDCCKIKSIGNLSHCTSLKRLNLSSNSITELSGLPETVEVVNLEDNPVAVLREACFPSPQVYDLLLKELKKNSQLSAMRQPPPQVLSRGYEAVKRYFKIIAIDDLLRNSRNRLVMVGPPMAGKTSLTRSLIANKPVLTHESDRTKVINIEVWNITSHDAFHIYDQGGHDIYSVTNPLFVSNQSTVLIHHDITKNSEDDKMKCLEVFQRILEQQPKNDIHFVVSHIDQIPDPQLLALNVKQFQQHIEKFLADQITLLENHQKKLEKYPSEGGGERVLAARGLLECYTELQKSVRFFPVSSQTFAGFPEIIDFLSKKAADSQVDIPRKWTQFFTRLATQDKTKMYLISDIELMFKDVYTGWDKLFKGKEITAQTHDCLRYLHDTGIVLWKHDHPVLKDYFFHNLDFIIDVFRCVFDHSLDSSLVYEKEPDLQVVFEADEIKDMLCCYQAEGLLNRKLLDYLWRKYNFYNKDLDAIISLMKSFGICYQVTPTDESLNDQFFFPWFVKNHTIPVELDINQPMVVNNNTVSLMLVCEYFRHIPVNVCEMLCVQLQKLAVTKHYNGHRKAWADGLMVMLDKTQCIVFRNVRTSTVCCCVRSPSEEVSKAWDSLTILYNELNIILSQWHGVVKSRYLQCAHCVFQSITHPRKWPVSKVWPSQRCVTEQYVRCDMEPEEDIPAGLVIANQSAFRLSQLNNDAVSKYIKDKWTDVPLEDRISPRVKSHLDSHRCYFHTIMFPQPIIDHLFICGALSTRQKREISALPVDSQAEELYRAVLNRGSKKVLVKLREALEKSEYHTNCTLARMIPNDASAIPDCQKPDVILSDDEVNDLKKNFYGNFDKHAKLNPLRVKLYSSGILNFYQDAEIKNLAIERDQAHYLLDNVLLRGTYETVQAFRLALSQTKQKQLIKSLFKRR